MSTQIDLYQSPFESLGIRPLPAAPVPTSALVPGQGKDSRTRQEEISKAAPEQHSCSGSPSYCLAAETKRLGLFFFVGFNWVVWFYRRSPVSIPTKVYNECCVAGLT